MSKLTDVKGVIFDYGGTIDTNSRHWAEVLWSKYEEFQVPVDKTSFREAYVHGERTLARVPLVKPEHNFHDVLRIKKASWTEKKPVGKTTLRMWPTAVTVMCWMCWNVSVP